MNGQLEGTSNVGAQTIRYDGTDVGIGKHPFFGSRHFNGLIDEVEIYNRALSASEILAIFAADSAGKCKPGSVRAAYVANAGSNTVSVINTTTNTVVATVAVGINPVNVVLR